MRSQRHWSVLGRLASIVLKRADGDARPMLVREHELARYLGLTRGTLRNYRDGVRLVRTVSHPALRHALLRLSAAAAMQMVRWLQRDFDAAVTFLQQRPSAGPTEILAAQRSSIIASSRRRGHRRLPSIETVLEHLPDQQLWLRREISEPLAKRGLVPLDQRLVLSGGSLEGPVNDLDRFLRINWLLAMDHGSRVDPWMRPPQSRQGVPARAAVVEIARYDLLEQYATQARTIWARAVVVANVYPLVIVLFPGPASRRHFLSALPAQLLVKDPYSRTGAELGQAHDGPLVFPGPGNGGIIFTTRLNGLKDLRG